MLLYIVRHAWAEERDDGRWPNDDLRPLTGEGKKRFAKVARRLVNAGVRPTIVATSPLIRCRQTADILLKELPSDTQLVELDALRPGSNLDELIAWTAEQPGDVAWVGHAPDVGDLTAALIGDATASIRFAKAATAALEFAGPPARDKAQLNWLATAKVLGE